MAACFFLTYREAFINGISQILDTQRIAGCQNQALLATGPLDSHHRLMIEIALQQWCVVFAAIGIQHMQATGHRIAGAKPLQTVQ